MEFLYLYLDNIDKSLILRCIIVLYFIHEQDQGDDKDQDQVQPLYKDRIKTRARKYLYKNSFCNR